MPHLLGHVEGLIPPKCVLSELWRHNNVASFFTACCWNL